jgi:hypothetical protein
MLVNSCNWGRSIVDLKGPRPSERESMSGPTSNVSVRADPGKSTSKFAPPLTTTEGMIKFINFPSTAFSSEEENNFSTLSIVCSQIFGSILPGWTTVFFLFSQIFLKQSDSEKKNVLSCYVELVITTYTKKRYNVRNNNQRRASGCVYVLGTYESPFRDRRLS